MAKNKVIAGTYLYGVVRTSLKGIYIQDGFKKREINKVTVERFEIIDKESSKSGTSAVMRGAVGAAILGPVGLLAGVSAKTKNAYTVEIYWKDGAKSMIEIDNKLYQALVRVLY